jgi:hypothetical protein
MCAAMAWMAWTWSDGGWAIIILGPFHMMDIWLVHVLLAVDFTGLIPYESQQEYLMQFRPEFRALLYFASASEPWRTQQQQIQRLRWAMTELGGAVMYSI